MSDLLVAAWMAVWLLSANPVLLVVLAGHLGARPGYVTLPPRRRWRAGPTGTRRSRFRALARPPCRD
jgi:hypothetical protein